MTRVTALLVAIATAATSVGWVLGAMLMLRVEHIDSELKILAARLVPINPKTALCTLSAQMQTLHATIAAHCTQVHGTSLLGLSFPRECGSLADWAPRGDEPGGPTD